MIRAVIYNIM